MYKQVAELINAIEDEVLGADSWAPPRSFQTGGMSERLYATYPESMLPVEGVPTVTALCHRQEIVFISNTGAIEIHRRVPELQLARYKARSETLLFGKPDAGGNGVWPEEAIASGQ